MKTITISVTQIPPSFLFLFRWAARVAKAKVHVCGPRRRKEVAGSTYIVDGSVDSSLTGAKE